MRRFSMAALVVLALIAVGSNGGLETHAATFQSKNWVKLAKIGTFELTSSVTAVDRVAMGTTRARVGADWSVALDLATPAFVPAINRDIDDLWKLSFQRGEWIDGISPDVRYTVRDRWGRTGSLSARNDPNSQVLTTVSTTRLTEERYLDGSLKTLSGSVRVAFDPTEVRSAEAHQGEIEITLTFL